MRRDKICREICRKICRKVSLDAENTKIKILRYSDATQDVALQKLPVRFILDRAGLVGADCCHVCLKSMKHIRKDWQWNAMDLCLHFLICNRIYGL